MFEVYNRNALTQKQRFLWAVAAGVSSSLLIGYLYGHILSNLAERFGYAMLFSIVYVAIGYGIGWVIQTVGRGVQLRFSVLGAVCAILCFVLADLIFHYPYAFYSFSTFAASLQNLVINLFNPSIIIENLFKLIGIYYAYVNSRFVR